MFDFEKVVDRRHTHALKHEKYHGEIIPMWVADSEFISPQPVLDALQKRVDHGIFGYTKAWDSLNQSVIDWVAAQHKWQVDADWLVWLPGVVPGFNAVCRAFCDVDNSIAIQTPNYPPLLAAPTLHGAHCREIPTIISNGRWTIDYEILEEQLKQKDCKLFILCNPLNPCGSVLNKAELQTVVELCQLYDVVLCADEIHCDIRLDPNAEHFPIGSLDPNSITLMAASKTFNFAGLSCSFAIIPDAKIRKKFIRAADGLLAGSSLMGYLATEAAFREGYDWHRALLEHLRGNRDELVRRVNSIRGLSVISPQATFLAWVDASELGGDPYQQFLQAGVAPSAGEAFGSPEFVRLNFACSRSVLDEALGRLEAALTP